MVTPSYGVVLFIAYECGPTVLVSPFRIVVPYQTRVLTSLPEVHAPRDPGPYLSGFADTQRLCEKIM